MSKKEAVKLGMISQIDDDIIERSVSTLEERLKKEEKKEEADRAKEG